MPDTPTPAPKAKRDRSRSGHSQTIPLRSGGSVTLTGTFNLFSMSPDDVAFVSELGAKMREYNPSIKELAKPPATPTPPVGRPATSTGPTLPKTN